MKYHHFSYFSEAAEYALDAVAVPTELLTAAINTINKDLEEEIVGYYSINIDKYNKTGNAEGSVSKENTISNYHNLLPHVLTKKINGPSNGPKVEILISNLKGDFASASEINADSTRIIFKNIWAQFTNASLFLADFKNITINNSFFESPLILHGNFELEISESKLTSVDISDSIVQVGSQIYKCNILDFIKISNPKLSNEHAVEKYFSVSSCTGGKLFKESGAGFFTIPRFFIDFDLIYSTCEIDLSHIYDAKIDLSLKTYSPDCDYKVNLSNINLADFRLALCNPSFITFHNSMWAASLLPWASTLCLRYDFLKRAKKNILPSVRTYRSDGLSYPTGINRAYYKIFANEEKNVYLQLREKAKKSGDKHLEDDFYFCQMFWEQREKPGLWNFIYYHTCGYGFSILRPACWFLFIIILFAVGYYFGTPLGNTWLHFSEALHLSVAASIPVINNIESAIEQLPADASFRPDSFLPAILFSVFYLQKTIQAVLIFEFGSAIRNRVKK